MNTSVSSPKMPSKGLPVIQAKDIKDDKVKLTADVVIVGSGAGGAVAAYELAKTGKKVIVLEAGPYVPSEQFSEMLAVGMGQLYQDQGGQSNLNKDFTYLQGACVGGSTVVNATVCFRTPDYYLKLWAKEYGTENLTTDSLTPYFERVEKHLSIRRAVREEMSADAHKLIEGCEKAGIPWKASRRNVRFCALSGACLSGCVTDRKQSMLVTYLPWAAAHGAKIYSDTFVTRVKEKDGKVTGVVAEIKDQKSGQKIANMEIDAAKVILAAGAVQTPLILLKSKIANSSGQVGKNYACHPSLSVTGYIPGLNQDFYGAWHSMYVDEYTLPEKGGYILLSGIQDPVEAVLNAEPGTGKPFVEHMQDCKNLIRFITLIHDRNHGEVLWEDGVKKIKYEMHDKDFPYMVAAMKKSIEVLFAAGASKIYLPTSNKIEINDPSEVDQVLDSLKNEPARYRYVSYHPQGTCRMGSDPKQSVVNPYGESHDVKGLFVADASLLPTSIGYNPQQTVYTLASYIADHINKKSN